MNQEILILVLSSGAIMIAKTHTEDSDTKPGKKYILEDPLGITYAPDGSVSPGEDRPYGILDVLLLADTNIIKIHEDHIIYSHGVDSEISRQYNQFLLSRLGPVLDDETMASSVELIDDDE